MKRFTSLILILSIGFLAESCATKLDVCECLSFQNAITDQYLLSEKERKQKEEGCKWIYEEYSDLELVKKWAECAQNELNQMKQNQNDANNQVNSNNTATPEQSSESIYYPVNNSGVYQTQTVALHYWNNPDGNKPYAEMRFTDGTTFTLMPSCEGEYDWCIRNSSNEEVGYLKIEPDSEGEAVFLDVRDNENSSSFTNYLSYMTGTFRLMH